MCPYAFVFKKRRVEWIKDRQGAIGPFVNERLYIIKGVVGVFDFAAGDSGQGDDKDSDKFSHIADKVCSRLFIWSRIYNILVIL